MSKYAPKVNGQSQFRIKGKDGLYSASETGIYKQDFDPRRQNINDYGEVDQNEVEKMFKQVINTGYKRYNYKEFINETGFGPNKVKWDDVSTQAYLGRVPIGSAPTRLEETGANQSVSKTDPARLEYLKSLNDPKSPNYRDPNAGSSQYPQPGQTQGDLFTNPHTGTTYNWRTGAIVNDPQGKGAALLPAKATTNAGGVNSVGGVNTPVVSPYMGNIGGAVAGTSGVSSYIDVQQQIAQDRQKQIEANQKALQKSTQPLLDKLLGSKSPSEARKDAQEETGIDPAQYFADQKQKIAEIESLTQEYNATKAAMEAQIAASGDKMASNNFINNQVAQIQRNAAPKLNMMSANINSKAATLEALQGNFNEAQNFVNQAVQDATAEYKYNMDVYTTFYEMNRDIMDFLDEPYKQAYEAKLDLVKVQYQQAVDEANNVAELMMDNPKAGITITDTFASAAQKVARSGGSLDYRQEMRLGSGGGSGGRGAGSDIDTYAQAYLDEEIEITSIPQDDRAAVLKRAKEIANEALSTPETTEPVKPSLSKNAQAYWIKSGDTFFNLAQAYGTTVDALRRANPRANPNNLKAGQQIVLPGKPSIIDSITNFLYRE